MRLVDADKLHPDVMKIDGSMAISQGQLAHAKTVEAIPKAEYEARLKAEKVAMLEELQSEIKESDSRAGYAGNGMPTFSTDYIRKKKVNELIRRKINELKGKVRDKE